MKLLWRTAALVVSVALISGAAIIWRIASTHRQLTEEASNYQLRAEPGDANAQYELARLYYQGKGVPRDYAQAFSWYHKAADQGDGRAQNGVGFMYDTGKGIPQNYEKAAFWYRKAADQGNSKAQYGLGYLYHEGKGVGQDHNAAIALWRKAADQGNARAQYVLGYSYFEGKDLPQDYATALAWFRKAADQDNAEAQIYLGYMYHQGKGVPLDAGEGIRWYHKAAEQGNAQAQYDLGYIYYYGVGVPQNRAEASRLFHAAASQGNEDAKRFTGLNKCLAVAGVMLPLEFLFGLYFTIVSLKSKQGLWNREQLVVAAAAVLMMYSFAMDLVWYGYIGHLQSSTTISTVYFARHLINGTIVALLLFIVIPKRTKVILLSAVALLIAYITIQIVHCELKHVAPTIRLFWFVGFPIGMAIPPAIILCLDHRNGGGAQRKDDTGVVPVEVT